jgi:hypothetical protein
MEDLTYTSNTVALLRQSKVIAADLSYLAPIVEIGKKTFSTTKFTVVPNFDTPIAHWIRGDAPESLAVSNFMSKDPVGYLLMFPVAKKNGSGCIVDSVQLNSMVRYANGRICSASVDVYDGELCACFKCLSTVQQVIYLSSTFNDDVLIVKGQDAKPQPEPVRAPIDDNNVSITSLFKSTWTHVKSFVNNEPVTAAAMEEANDSDEDLPKAKRQKRSRPENGEGDSR